MENLRALSDDALLSGLHALLGCQRQLLARLLGYLGEVEERRLHLKAAYSSLFSYCLGELRMSDDEACRRIAAARLARRFPLVLQHVESGALHLSALGELSDHLTEDNHEELLRAASGKTKREVRALVAARFPKPDVPSAIGKLAQQAPLPVAAASSESDTAKPPGLPAPARVPSRVEPLSATRYKVQFTASEELRDKLELCKDRLSHVNPSGDLAVVVERALDLLLAELEKTRLAKARHPRPAAPPADPGTVTRAARREVFERDGERCTYVDEKTGRRCDCRALLQVDHREPRARGGSGKSENLRVLCAAHNRLVAEEMFGREHLERAKRAKGAQRRSPQTTTGRSERAVAECQDAQVALERAKIHDKLACGLTHLGFRSKDVKRALGELFREKCAAPPLPPIEELMREALWTLCPQRPAGSSVRGSRPSTPGARQSCARQQPATAETQARA